MQVKRNGLGYSGAVMGTGVGSVVDYFKAFVVLIMVYVERNLSRRLAEAWVCSHKRTH